MIYIDSLPNIRIKVNLNLFYFDYLSLVCDDLELIIVKCFCWVNEQMEIGTISRIIRE